MHLATRPSAALKLHRQKSLCGIDGARITGIVTLATDDLDRPRSDWPSEFRICGNEYSDQRYSVCSGEVQQPGIDADH